MGGGSCQSWCCWAVTDDENELAGASRAARGLPYPAAVASSPVLQPRGDRELRASLQKASYARSFASSEKQCSCCSVAQSCPTLCDPMDCSMPGFPVLHHLPEFVKLLSTESVMPSNHLILCRPFVSCPQSFSASGQGRFQKSRLFTSGGQSIGASASASVLPMNIQG